jgi:hypothetical protein
MKLHNCDPHPAVILLNNIEFHTNYRNMKQTAMQLQQSPASHSFFLFLPVPVPRNHRSSYLVQRRQRHTLLFSFIILLLLLLLLRSQHSGTQRLAFVLKSYLLTKCHRLLPLPRGPPPPCTCPRSCRCASSAKRIHSPCLKPSRF